MSLLSIFRKAEHRDDEIVDTTFLPNPSDKGVNNAQEISEVEPENNRNIELYVVSWKSRYDSFSQDTKRVAKAFISEEEADNFIKDLKKAAAFLQYTENLEIRKEKQL